MVLEMVLKLVHRFLRIPGWASEKFAWGITACSCINTFSYSLWKRKFLGSVAIQVYSFLRARQTTY